MHYTVAQINRIKDRIIDRIDESLEYQELLKRVRKDARRMMRGQLNQKYSRDVITDALNTMGATV